MEQITVRQIKQEEYPELREFLYLSIFVPEGSEPAPRSLLDEPEFQVYLDRFGEQPHDRGLVAEDGGKLVGAIWARIMDDFGHIDDQTPSLAISLLPQYRGRGIGTALMEGMLALLKQDGHRRVSLSVQRANCRAVGLYEKTGFQVFREEPEEYIMVRNL